MIYFYSDLVSYWTDDVESGMFDISGETFGSIFKHSKHLCKNLSTPVDTASESWFQVLVSLIYCNEMHLEIILKQPKRKWEHEM